jgi:hypothetical protein
VSDGGSPLQSFVARYLPNGRLDVGFGTDGFSSTSYASGGSVNGMTLATGGKIVVVGSSGGDFAVARFLP